MMKTNSYINFVQKNSGSTLFIALVIIMILTVITVEIIQVSQNFASTEYNYKRKFESLLSTDAQITLLAQELIDGNRALYITILDSANCFYRTSHEAEAASLSNAVKMTTFSNYKGSGYIHFTTTSNSSLEWNITLTSTVSYNVGFRYSLSAGTSKVSFTLQNPEQTTNEEITFSSTGSGSVWDTLFLVKKLTYGSNKLRLSSISGSSPCFDQLILTEGGAGKSAVSNHSFTVDWSVQETFKNNYVISAQASLGTATNNNNFRTKLKQVLQIADTSITIPLNAIQKIPVTFYDFHSDRRNPEFEQPHKTSAVALPGMIQNKLDSDRKPVFKENKSFNTYIYYWFRDSKNFTGSVNFYPTTVSATPASGRCRNSYDETGATLKNPNPSYGSAAAKDAFENKIINTTLDFTHIGNGIFQIENYDFFPIDNQGLGKEWSWAKECIAMYAYDHNYSYTMEMKTTFLKRPGLIFNFAGDDDVWLFINDSLVLDLGGLHHSASMNLKIDDIPGLINNKTYNFDFFYCERHSPGSSIKIQTNIMTPVPVAKNKQSWSRDYNLDL